VRILGVAFLERAQFLVEGGYSRSRAQREPIKQIAVLELIEDVRPSQASKIEKCIR
jgi:hypothetical protein